jgi:hypothetical protein
VEHLWRLELENVIADGDRLVEVANLPSFIEREEEDAAQGVKRNISLGSLV